MARWFYIIFSVSTGITLFILFKDIDNSFSFKFVIGYGIFLFLFLIYFIGTVIIKIGKLGGSDIKKRVYNFTVSFVFISGLGIIYHYFFKSTGIDYYRILPIGFGLSLGLSFFDLVFSKKKTIG